MVDTGAQFETGPRHSGHAADLRHLQVRLADMIAAARTRGDARPTVRALAAALGVDTDLVLLALGTMPAIRD